VFPKDLKLSFNVDECKPLLGGGGGDAQPVLKPADANAALQRSIRRVLPNNEGTRFHIGTSTRLPK